MHLFASALWANYLTPDRNPCSMISPLLPSSGLLQCLLQLTRWPLASRGSDWPSSDTEVTEIVPLAIQTTCVPFSGRQEWKGYGQLNLIPPKGKIECFHNSLSQNCSGLLVVMSASTGRRQNHMGTPGLIRLPFWAQFSSWTSKLGPDFPCGPVVEDPKLHGRGGFNPLVGELTSRAHRAQPKNNKERNARTYLSHNSIFKNQRSLHSLASYYSKERMSSGAPSCLLCVRYDASLDLPREMHFLEADSLNHLPQQLSKEQSTN